MDLERGDALDRGIVLLLVGRPHRYAQLRPLLRGRTENQLDQALKRLEMVSLVRTRSHSRSRRPQDLYELTELGIDTVLALAQRKLLDRWAANVQRPRSRDASTA